MEFSYIRLSMSWYLYYLTFSYFIYLLFPINYIFSVLSVYIVLIHPPAVSLDSAIYSENCIYATGRGAR